MNILTLNSKQIWQSPDGSRTLFEVMFTSEDEALAGKHVKAQTYSQAIAETGWSGEVESYKKSDKQGNIQTYLRQPPKETGYSNLAPSKSSQVNKEFNTQTMYYSYAKDVAVALVEGPGLTTQRFEDAINLIILGGDKLFDSATLGLAIHKEVELGLNGRGRVEEVMGKTKVDKDLSDPFNEATPL